jgi:DNA-binding NarL/FixJ family response regulator
MYVSSGTVRNHVARLLSKLEEVHSRLQALVFAVRYGLVDMERR